MMKKVVVVFLFCVIFQVQSQSNFSGGWLPKINLSTKISDKIKWVNSVEFREDLYSNKQFNFQYKLIDVTSVISFKTNINESFNVGYVVRFFDKKVVYRFLQHYNFILNFDELKLANRLGFEQFFAEKSKPQYRTRYRMAIQKALQGQRIDVKEFYIKMANEYLYQFTKEDLETRLVSYIGYKLSKNEKLEFGFEYRLSKFLKNTPKNNLWFRTTWYISL